ncbi:MAG: hypothetical protein Q8P77_01955 [Candidatus Veblenbacteria bacterium]|nr:hypothetical protein [Candidatus Veblenbacteria bacterium]
METLEIVDPFTVIEGLRNEISIMGANGEEMSLIDGIEEQLRAQKISAEEAVKQVQGIKDSKQGYH